MTREEAIRELKADYCGNHIICELYPDQCNREDCEIWLAIKALETQPDGDTISRQAAIDVLRICYDTETITMDNGDEYINYEDAMAMIEELPSSPLIRCKDCVHVKYNSFSTCYCKHMISFNTPNGFCSHAERRTDGTEQP